MKIRRYLRLYSLALALLLGQWLTLAHGFQHDVFTPEPACQLCIHGHGLDAALPLAGASPPLSLAAQEAPWRGAPVAIARTPRAAYRSRAPPVVLA